MNNKGLADIFAQSGIRYYDEKYRFLIKNAISDLFQTNYDLLKLINIYHLDRAIFKYREACENKKIYNPRNYFRACLKSALEELIIDE